MKKKQIKFTAKDIVNVINNRQAGANVVNNALKNAKPIKLPAR